MTARILQHAPLQECGLALKEFLAEFDEAKESFKGFNLEDVEIGEKNSS